MNEFTELSTQINMYVFRKLSGTMSVNQLSRVLCPSQRRLYTARYAVGYFMHSQVKGFCRSCQLNQGIFLKSKHLKSFKENIPLSGLLLVRFKSNTTSAEPVDFDKLFPLRYVYVRTSLSTWEEYPEGVQFDVGYVDSKLQKGQNSAGQVPVIVALPSTVGNHFELSRILLTFVKLGYRVVIPNLPGSVFCRGRAKTDEAVFRMSIEEKTEFVKDFLTELQIDRVDMLLTNKCSVYTGVRLCTFYPDLCKSLVMINPTGLEPTSSMKPVWLHVKFSKLYDDRFILQGVFSAIVGVVKQFTKKRHWDTCNIVTYSRSISALSFDDEKLTTGYLKSHSVPRLAIFGEDSDLLDVKSTEEYLSCMDIPDSAITVLDQQNSVVKQGVPVKGNFAIHIQGDLDADITRTMFIRKQLLDFLKTVYPKL